MLDFEKVETADGDFYFVLVEPQQSSAARIVYQWSNGTGVDSVGLPSFLGVNALEVSRKTGRLFVAVSGPQVLVYSRQGDWLQTLIPPPEWAGIQGVFTGLILDKGNVFAMQILLFPPGLTTGPGRLGALANGRPLTHLRVYHATHVLGFVTPMRFVWSER